VIKVLAIVNDQPIRQRAPLQRTASQARSPNASRSSCACSCPATRSPARSPATSCPRANYHLDRTLKPLVRRNEIGCCGTCMDARGLKQEQLVDGARQSTLEESLTDFDRSGPTRR
jgi:hypothetical protein